MNNFFKWADSVDLTFALVLLECVLSFFLFLKVCLLECLEDRGKSDMFKVYVKHLSKSFFQCHLSYKFIFR